MANRYLQISWIVILVISVLAFQGVSKLRYDDNYHNLFRSGHPFFTEYEEFRRDFPLDENDLIVLATAADITSSGILERLYEFDRSLRDEHFINAVFSIFDLQAVSENDYGEELYPGSAAAESAIEEFRVHLKRHPMSREILVSEKFDAALFVVTLAGEQLSVAEIEPMYLQIRRLAEAVSDTNLRLVVTGIPALRTAVVRSTQRDQIMFQGIGILLCILLALLMFRSVAAVAITNLTAIAGPFWTLGAMGYLGLDIDPVNVIAPTLLLILGFADSVHMVSCIKDRLAAGDSSRQAAGAAIRRVGPACVMTTSTTMVAFVSLSIFSDSVAIQRFGMIGAGGMLAVLTTVLILLPALSVWLLKNPVKTADGHWHNLDKKVQDVVGNITRWAIRRAVLLSATGLVFIMAATVLVFQLTVDYRYADHIPDKNNAYAGLMLTEEKMGGAMPLRIFIDLPDDSSTALTAADTILVLRRIHAILVQEPMTHGPFSVLNVFDSMPLSYGLEEKVADLELLTGDVLNRLVNVDKTRILVSAYMPDPGSASMEPMLEKLEHDLRGLEQEFTGYRIRASGLFVTSSRVGHRAIPELAVSLAFAALTICLLVVVGLRSWRLGLISILPNVFPIVTLGAVMYLIDIPLQYITVLSFTVCLGVTVDDTIHWLYRFRQLKDSGLRGDQCVIQTSRQIGRALVITTIVISVGMVVLALSESSITRQFGVLSASAVLLALFGDLVILAALVKYFDRPKITTGSRGVCTT